MTFLPPRPVRYALAWVGAAAVAVAVGLLALQLLGGDIGPSVAAGATTSVTPSAASPTSRSAATSPSGLYRTPGGTVYGTCAGPGSHPVVSVVADPGWEASTARSDTEARIEGGDTEYRIVVTCNASGVPVFTPTGDDHHDAGSTAPGASSTPTSGDDHGGSGGSGGGASAPATSGTRTPEPGDDSGGHGGSSAPSPTTGATRTSGGGGSGGGGSGGGHGGNDSSPHG